MNAVDLDLKLALDALDARQVPPAASDWEERLHAALQARPPRARRARLRLLVAACVALAVFVFVASGAGAWVGLPNPFGSGFHLLGPTHHTAAPSPTPKREPSQPAPRVTKTSVKHIAVVTLPHGTAVPAGFRAASVTFVSMRSAYLLGQASGTRAVLLRTSDRGRHWVALPAPRVPVGSPAVEGERCVWSVRFADVVHGFLFGNGLWETTDGGAHWARVAAPAGGILSLATIDGQVLALVSRAHGSGATLERRSLAGGAWHDLATVRSAASAYDGDLVSTQAGAAAVLDGRTVLVTTDGGLTLVRHAVPVSSFAPAAVAATGADSLVLVATREVSGRIEERVFTSADGGRRWTRVNAPADAGVVTALAGSPGGLVLATAGADSRLYRSADGGRTWSTALVSPEAHGWGWRDLGFTTDADAIVVLGPRVAGRLLLSSTGGATWHAVRLGPAAPAAPRPSAGATAPPTKWPAAPSALRDVWHHVRVERAPFLSVDFAGHFVGWALAGSRAYVTVNGGATWTTRGPALPGRVSGIACVDAAHAWVVGSGPSGSEVLQTTDGGATWSRTTFGGFYERISAIDAAHAWVVGSSAPAAVKATTDGGATWVDQPIHGVTLGDVCFVDDRRGWAVGYDAIVATVDGGATWSRELLPVGAVELDCVRFIDARHGWAAGVVVHGALADRSVVLATSDGGAHWTLVFTGDPETWLVSLAFSDRLHGWALGQYGAVRRSFLLVTRDGGVHWRTELASHAQLDGLALRPPHGACAVGLSGTVLTTAGRP